LQVKAGINLLTQNFNETNRIIADKRDFLYDENERMRNKLTALDKSLKTIYTNCYLYLVKCKNHSGSVNMNLMKEIESNSDRVLDEQ
jgi:hypothetical protein